MHMDEINTNGKDIYLFSDNTWNLRLCMMRSKSDKPSPKESQGYGKYKQTKENCQERVDFSG